MSVHPFIKLLNKFDTQQTKRGYEFEKLSKWILKKHPVYSSLFKKVWLWKDWPNRWGRDCGIDLVAEDLDGRIWAIQAKCYDQKYYVTKDDIDKFLSESTNKNIHYRLLIATTDNIGSNALGVIQRQQEIIPINKLMLSDILDSPINWPKSFSNLSEIKAIKRFRPRNHQKLAIKNVAKNLHSRGQLIMACGTGKTLTGLWISEKLNAQTTLILLPSLLLLSKTLIDWLTHKNQSFKYLPVCSDETASNVKDLVSLSRSDLSFPSTTDVKEINNFLIKPGKKVIFATYQSSKRIVEAFKKYKINPIDLLIADEAHRCAGDIDSEYANILDEKKIIAKKRLFMTATPRKYKTSFRKTAENSGIQIASMDDQNIFGPVLHKLSFGDAISPPDGSNPLLSDYQVVITGIDSRIYSTMIEKRSLIKTKTNIKTDAQTLASQISLSMAIKKYDLKRVISFHSRVSSAKEFSEMLPKTIDWMSGKYKPVNEIQTSYVSGEMPTGERNIKLKALENISSDQAYILSNARCLSEGVDVPALDGIAFIDPRNSEIDIVQAVGRAIRLSSKKKVGTIVIPIFINEDKDPEEELKSSAFKKVWTVVNALRSHDEDLGEQLDEIRKSIGKRGKVGKVSKIIFDIPSSVGNKFEKALETKLIEFTTSSWMFWYGLLESYKKEFGHLRVVDKKTSGERETYKGYRLGAWVGKQRQKKDSLSNRQIELLESIGFVWDPYQEAWDRGLSSMKKFKKEFGHCSIKDKSFYEDFGLGTWATNQRKNKKRGKLSKEKIRLLNEIGFIWEYEDPWEKGLNKFIEYKKEFGHCNVKDKSHYKNFPLGNWVSKNRSHFKRGNLSDKKIKILKDLKFSFNPLEEKWQHGYQELLKYKKINKDCLVSRGYRTEDNFKLDNWVTLQRSSIGSLSKEKINLLNKAGFIWDVKKFQWNKGIQELKNYKNIFGDLLVPAKYVSKSNYPLGSWVGTKRNEMKKGKISDEKIKLLEKLGFVWDPYQEAWDRGLSSMKKFKKEFGHCSVKDKSFYEDFGLGTWVSNQRANKKRGKLSKEKIRLLNEIGFIWDGRK